MATGTSVLCPLCGAADTDLGPGPGGRPAAACRSCGSLERHRLLAILLETFAARASAGILLDVAPTSVMTPLLSGLEVGTYVGMDFDPGADGRIVDVQGSVTALPFADDCLALVICFHVLEHVPDDLTAMRELARALAPDGFALVQVPVRPGPTDEDPDAPAAERIRRFGQADHVRYYGIEDFENRLRLAGLHLLRVRTADVVPPDLVDLCGLNRDELFWLCAADRGAAWTMPELREEVLRHGAEVLDRLLHLAATRGAVTAEQSRAATARSAAALQELARSTKRLRKSRRRLARLRARPEVRAGAIARAGIRRSVAVARAGWRRIGRERGR